MEREREREGRREGGTEGRREREREREEREREREREREEREAAFLLNTPCSDSVQCACSCVAFAVMRSSDLHIIHN